METTAGQIAAYRGDANTAVGSSPGGQSGLTGIYGEADTSGIDRLSDPIYLMGIRQNAEDYQRKLQERDQLRDMLQSEQLQLGRALPNDRDYIKQNYVDKMRHLLISTPDITRNNQKYQELQNLISDFKDAKANAGVRLATVTQMDNAIAAETDPQKRAAMTQHRNKIYNQGLFDEVTPYQQTLGWSPDIFAKPNPIESKDQLIQGDRLIDVSSSITPLKDFTDQTYYNYIKNPNSSVKDQMDVFAKTVNSLPDDQKQKKVEEWNARIQAANNDAGYTDKDPYYVQPIRMDTDPSTGAKIITSSNPELVRAQAIQENYKKTNSAQGKVSEIPSKIVENKMNAKKLLNDATLLIPSQAAENYAQAAKSKADTNKTIEEVRTARNAIAEKGAVGDWYINQLLQMMDPKKYGDLPDQGTPVDVRYDKDKKYATLGDLGTSGKILAYKDQDGNVHSSLSDLELNAIGLRFVSGKDGVTVAKPQTVVYNYSNPKDPYFIATYTYQANGQEKKETKIIRPSMVLEGLIKGVVGEQTTGKENDDFKTTMRRYRERAGSENINGSVISLTEQPDFQAQQSVLEKKRSFFK